jgi:hypothetical protein
MTPAAVQNLGPRSPPTAERIEHAKSSSWVVEAAILIDLATDIGTRAKIRAGKLLTKWLSAMKALAAVE